MAGASPPGPQPASSVPVHASTVPSAYKGSPHAHPVPKRYTGPGLAAFVLFVAVSSVLQQRAAAPSRMPPASAAPRASDERPEAPRKDDEAEEDDDEAPPRADGRPAEAPEPRPDRAFGPPPENLDPAPPPPVPVAMAATPPSEAPPPPPPAGTAPASAPAPAPANTDEIAGAEGLAKELTDVMASIADAGHEPGQALATVEEARRELAAFDKDLRTYRSVARTGPDKDRADAFAQKADQARGLIQKAIVELHLASRQVLEGNQGEQLGDPFAKTRAATRTAQAALDAARESSRGAP